MSSRDEALPDWDRVLSAAARLQDLVPDAVLVGGTASALHAGHRLSRDADHVVRDLKGRFDQVLTDLETVSGWRTARINRPVQILGSLDGIETGIRQLIRSAPLDTVTMDVLGASITLPTLEEILRIKAALVLKRNATRDYLDFVALADRLGAERTAGALLSLDVLYPQPNGESALQQLVVQLSNPLPYDLDSTRLDEYKQLVPRWHRWSEVVAVCVQTAKAVFLRLPSSEADQASDLAP